MPLNPLRGVTVTVNVVDWPGRTAFDEGLTEMSKSALAGRTVMVRVGGLGSELPTRIDHGQRSDVLSRRAERDVARVLCCRGCRRSARETPTSTWPQSDVVPKETDCPAAIVMSEAGDEIVPCGGAVA